jgi:hypothetical protein
MYGIATSKVPRYFRKKALSLRSYATNNAIISTPRPKAPYLRRHCGKYRNSTASWRRNYGVTGEKAERTTAKILRKSVIPS